MGNTSWQCDTADLDNVYYLDTTKLQWDIIMYMLIDPIIRVGNI